MSGIDEPPGMTASRLLQPPCTPPQWVASNSRNGTRTKLARDLFEMAVRGVMTGDLNDV